MIEDLENYYNNLLIYLTYLTEYLIDKLNIATIIHCIFHFN